MRATAVSVIGTSHVVDGIPCQDASRVYQGEGVVVAAVADGHGSAGRSDEGAQIAVSVACSLLAELGKAYYQSSLNQLKHTVRAQVGARILREWTRRVAVHAGDEDARGTLEERQEQTGPFGTTLLACLVLDEVAVYLQLGDGELVAFDAQGNPRRFFEDDPDLMGTETRSMCNSDAVSRLQIHVEPFFRFRPHLVLLVTDGVGDSFSEDEDGVAALGRYYLDECRKPGGFESIAIMLAENLGEMSRKGSTDDASLALVYCDHPPGDPPDDEVGEEEPADEDVADRVEEALNGGETVEQEMVREGVTDESPDEVVVSPPMPRSEGSGSGASRPTSRRRGRGRAGRVGGDFVPTRPSETIEEEGRDVEAGDTADD